MKVAVIGAGITGLSIANYLSEKNVEVDIFESTPRAGGLAGTFDYNGLKIDRFYHHFYTHDIDLLQLFDDLGLKENIVWETTPTGMYYANKAYRLSTPFDLIKFRPLPFIDRIRMGLLVLKAKRPYDIATLEKMSAKDWLTKEARSNVYKVMWEPLLRNKFGKHADKISAAWIFSKFNKRGASRSKGGSEKLGYLKGGLGLFLDRFTDKLGNQKVNINFSDKVCALKTVGGKTLGVKLESGKEIANYDLTISTLSPELTADLIDNSFKNYFDSLKRIKYLANLTLILFLKNSLSNYYWLNVNDPQCPFVGIIEHTKLIDIKEYKGINLVYISKYLPKEDKLFKFDKNELFAFYLPWIKKIFPDFSNQSVMDKHLCKDIYTQPIIETDYSKLIPKVETPIKNFYTVSMAQIYPEDRQISNSVRDGKKFAYSILKANK